MSLYGKSMVVSVGKHLIGEVIFRRVWSRVIGSVCSVEKWVGEARSRFSWRLVGNRGDFLEWRPRTQRQWSAATLLWTGLGNVRMGYIRHLEVTSQLPYGKEEKEVVLGFPQELCARASEVVGQPGVWVYGFYPGTWSSAWWGIWWFRSAFVIMDSCRRFSIEALERSVYSAMAEKGSGRFELRLAANITLSFAL